MHRRVTLLSTRRMSAALALAVMGLCFACSDSSSGASGSATGTSCSSNDACPGGVCAKSKDFPDGYCTQGCNLKDPATCSAGSVCVDDVSGVPVGTGVTAICYQSCQSDADCAQSGFKCLEKASKKVCRNGS